MTREENEFIFEVHIKMLFFFFKKSLFFVILRFLCFPPPPPKKKWLYKAWKWLRSQYEILWNIDTKLTVLWKSQSPVKYTENRRLCKDIGARE